MPVFLFLFYLCVHVVALAVALYPLPPSQTTQQNTLSNILNKYKYLSVFLLRSFAKPPKAVQTVCECIVVMRGIREVSWKSAKGMMSEANFLKSLTEMDVDNINVKQTQAVKGSVFLLLVHSGGVVG